MVCSWDTVWVENLTLHQHAGCHGNGITICDDMCLIALPVLHDACKVYRIARNIRGVQISFCSFSVYQNENLTHETYVMMGMFSCVKMDRTKIKHMNQLEITQNEIWTPRKFPAIIMVTKLEILIITKQHHIWAWPEEVRQEAGPDVI